MYEEDVRQYLVKRYAAGQKGFVARNIAENVWPGYAPDSYKFDHTIRRSINQTLENIQAQGLVILRELRSEAAYHLYNGRFTEKMEEYCLSRGIATIQSRQKKAREALEALPPMQTPAVQNFVASMKVLPDSRFFLDYPDYTIATDVIRAADAICQGRDGVMARDLSMALFGDSKRFSAVKKRAIELVKRLEQSGANNSEEETVSDAEFLEKRGIYLAPVSFTIQGNLEIETPDGDVRTYGLPFTFLSNHLDKYQHIRVFESDFITIENETTFWDFHESATCKAFLSGFPTVFQRKILQMIARDNPETTFMHWSDIDVGGFRIFSSVRECIPNVEPYRMDADTLEAHKAYAKNLTSWDVKELQKWKKDPVFGATAKVMLSRERKLEQEAWYAADKED